MNSILLADGRRIDLAKPAVMGIINCTPDSFAVRCDTPQKAIKCALKMIDEGADILDIGGESTRPNSRQVSSEEELERVIPTIRAIRENSNIPISIDTTKAIVAEKALTAGADIVNDISGLAFDADMAAVAARYNCPVVIMHIKGNPGTMQKAPYYDDVIGEISDYFAERIDYAISQGVNREKIIVDAGIGFGKRLEDNLMIIKDLNKFSKFGLPIMIGASRKSLIGQVTGADTDNRIEGSLAIAAVSITNGADIIRVHDVAQTRQVVDMAIAIREV